MLAGTTSSKTWLNLKAPPLERTRDFLKPLNQGAPLSLKGAARTLLSEPKLPAGFEPAGNLISLFHHLQVGTS